VGSKTFYQELQLQSAGKNVLTQTLCVTQTSSAILQLKIMNLLPSQLLRGSGTGDAISIQLKSVKHFDRGGKDKNS